MDPAGPLLVHRDRLLAEERRGLHVEVEDKGILRPVVVPRPVHRHLAVVDVRVGFRVAA